MGTEVIHSTRGGADGGSKSPLDAGIPSFATIEKLVTGIAHQALAPTIRLAVTGLSDSGKSVFITALVNQLIHGGNLPFMGAVNGGRYVGAKIVDIPDASHAEFQYREFLSALTEKKPSWPEPTDATRQIRLALRYRPVGLVTRTIWPIRTIYLDIVDYPGEWLLDLALLGESFAAWSKKMFALCKEPPRAKLAKDWLEFVNKLKPADQADEKTLRKGHELYVKFLKKCKSPKLALSMLQPGRFTQPGDLAKEDVLVFFPCKPPRTKTKLPRTCIYRELAARYEKYKSQVVKKFYADHVADFDRQIVLVDVLTTLNNGYQSFADMREAITTVLRSFSYGQLGLFKGLFSHSIDKLLFAATKADHVASNQHHNLKLMLERMIAESARQVRFEGTELDGVAIASLKCTDTVVTEYQGRKLSCVKGAPVDRDKDTLLFPGEIPETMPTHSDWDTNRFNFLEFKPPRIPDVERTGLPHIRLDQALEFLIGDKLR